MATQQEALAKFQGGQWTADQYNSWAAAWASGNTNFNPISTPTPTPTPTPAPQPQTTPAPSPYAGGLPPNYPSNQFNTQTGVITKYYRLTGKYDCESIYYRKSNIRKGA